MSGYDWKADLKQATISPSVVSESHAARYRLESFIEGLIADNEGLAAYWSINALDELKAECELTLEVAEASMAWWEHEELYDSIHSDDSEAYNDYHNLLTRNVKAALYKWVKGKGSKDERG